VSLTATWVAPVDLDNCASEPIHVPGAIQPHGVLIAVTEPELVVAVVSANVADWFGVAPSDAVGLSLDELIGDDGRAVVDRVRTMEWDQRFDEVRLAHDGRPLIATLYRSGPYLVIEIERDEADETPSAMIVREAAMALQTSRSVLDVADAAARWVRSLSGFDRVMVYRFDADWNGEVIAERKRDDLNTFLGLHYPASDIPAQARELYRRNWLRLIPDIGYAAVRLVPPVAHDTAQPLDLSNSTLRSVSPIHVEYLTNMGVGASMSVSIVINGQLWGLIACHHYSGAHHVSVPARNAAEFLAQLISQRIAETLEADFRSTTIVLSAIADHVAHAFATAGPADIARVLREHEADVLALAGATGLVLRAAGTTVRLGIAPADEVVDRIIESWPAGDEVLQTNRLGTLCPAAAERPEIASGALAFALMNDRSELIAWFRSELVQAVDWGGDPHNAKLAATEGDHVRLSPRKSFDLWRETICGRAAPWDDSARQAAQRFTRHIGAALLRDERDSASLAKDLQRVMRPTALPAHPGFAFSVFAQSPGRGEIGGDWYDGVATDDEHIAVVVGDIAGHGLVAASEMAQVRNVLRAYLAEGGGPADALERLDRYMLGNLRGSIATVVCAVIDTTSSTLRISHAGHVPALLVNDAGADFVPLDGDHLLGFRAGRRTDRVVQLAVGDTLALYSDGLVETRRSPLDDGLAHLRKEAADVLAGRLTDDRAAELASRLLGEDHDDDVTVLLIGRIAET
jgi:chemotaxis family two-component system sensor kinase Cph1